MEDSAGTVEVYSAGWTCLVWCRTGCYGLLDSIYLSFDLQEGRLSKDTNNLLSFPILLFVLSGGHSNDSLNLSRPLVTTVSSDALLFLSIGWRLRPQRRLPSAVSQSSASPRLLLQIIVNATHGTYLWSFCDTLKPSNDVSRS